MMGAAAHAQDGASDQKAKEERDSLTLETIVVTSERVSFTEQEVPTSLTAFDAGDLAELGAGDFKDLSQFVPNLTIGGAVPFGESVPLFSIRGISTASGRISAEPGVGVYIDDLYYPRTMGSLLKLFDVETVEVTRGPQGTLFGRNSTAGTVQYAVKAPEPEFSARISGTYGTSNRADLSAMVNVPLGDMLALRVNAGTWNRDGYIDVLDRDGNRIHDSGNTDETAFRAALKFDPTEKLSIDVAYTRAKSKGISPASIITDFSVSDGPINAVNSGDVIPFDDDSLSPQIRGLQVYLDNNGLPPLVAQDPRFVSPSDDVRLFTCYLDQAGPIEGDYIPADELCTLKDDIESEVISWKLAYDLSDSFSLKYVGGIIDGDYDTRNILFGNLYNRINVTEVESQSHELVLNYTDDKVKALAGVYYFKEDPFEHTGDRAYLRFGPPFLQGTVEAPEEFVDAEVKTKAVFANLVYDFTDKFSLTVGARYSEDEKKTVIGFYDAVTGGANEEPIAEDYPGANYDWDGDGVVDAFTNSATFDSFDWRVSARYFLEADKMLYATVSTGFKGGGFSDNLVTHVPEPACGPGGAAGNCVPYDSPVRPFRQEDVVNYEVGVKADWLDGRMRTNLSLFAMDFQDIIIQFATFNQPRFGSPSLVVINAGDVVISGFEADGEIVLTDNWSVSGAVGYTNFDWSRLDPLSELYYFEECPDVEFADVTVDNCPIRDLKLSPDLSFTLGLNYQQDLWGGVLKGALNYGWTGAAETNNGPNSVRAESYGLLNLRVEWDSDDEDNNWSVALVGSNILGEDYTATGLNLMGDSPTYTSSFVPGRGAEWAITVEKRF
jgi:iron complex outermembrane receptor protein